MRGTGADRNKPLGPSALMTHHVQTTADTSPSPSTYVGLSRWERGTS